MKQRLLTPGPTPVPEETLLELAKPVVYHRTAEFRKLLAEVLDDLQYVFHTKNPVIPLTSSGTGGLEAAVVELRAARQQGHLPDRRPLRRTLAEPLQGVRHRADQRQRCPTARPCSRSNSPEPWPTIPTPAAVCSTLSETSTGVGHDIAAFGKLVAGTPALLLVDAISGLGAMECRTDDWHIDICVTGSQKALMLPPGLAFVSVSDKAWKAIDKNPAPRTFYFDLKKAQNKLETSDTPFTPAHTLIRRHAREPEDAFGTEGIENVWARHALKAAAARAGFQAMGLELFASPPGRRADRRSRCRPASTALRSCWRSWKSSTA